MRATANGKWWVVAASLLIVLAATAYAADDDLTLEQPAIGQSVPVPAGGIPVIGTLHGFGAIDVRSDLAPGTVIHKTVSVTEPAVAIGKVAEKGLYRIQMTECGSKFRQVYLGVWHPGGNANSLQFFYIDPEAGSTYVRDDVTSLTQLMDKFWTFALNMQHWQAAVQDAVQNAAPPAGEAHALQFTAPGVGYNAVAATGSGLQPIGSASLNSLLTAMRNQNQLSVAEAATLRDALSLGTVPVTQDLGGQPADPIGDLWSSLTDGANPTGATVPWGAGHTLTATLVRADSRDRMVVIRFDFK